MSKLGTLVDTKSEAFEKNTEAFSGLVEELRKLSAEARRGGGDKAQRRHRERGKLPVRERIERLLDPGTAFLEDPEHHDLHPLREDGTQNYLWWTYERLEDLRPLLG